MQPLTFGSGAFAAGLDPGSGSITVNHGGTAWTFAGPAAGFGYLGLEGKPLALGAADGVPLTWAPVGKRGLGAEGAVPGAKVRVRIAFALAGSDRLTCRLELKGPDCGKVTYVVFPYSPQLRGPAARVVVPQWLGLLVPAEGPDLAIRRTVWQRPLSMRFMGLTQTLEPDSPACLAILKDSLERLVEIRRDKGVAGFSYIGEPSYFERAAQVRTQSLEFRFLRGGYVKVAAAYRDWMRRRPEWRTLTARTRPCSPRQIGGAQMFGHIPCDYGGPTVTTFDEFIPRIRALKEAGVERAIFHLGGWNRDGYDSHYPDILPANPRCGGDEGMRRLTDAIDELGYVCTPHDDLAIISTDSPSFDTRLAARAPNGELHNGGVYREQQYRIATAEAQTRFAERNMPQVAKRFPRLHGYLFDVVTSYPPLEDHSTSPPISKAADIAARTGSLRVARREFSRFMVCESITDWAIEYLDAAFMAEEGYQHRGDGGWSVDALAGEIVPLWELVYHDSILGIRESTIHVNTPMETEDPFLRYLRIFLKTLRAGTLPPCFYSDDLRLNILASYKAGAKQECGGWSGLDVKPLLATVSKLSAWLADAVLTAPMVNHCFVGGSLYRERTVFRTPRGPVTVTVNTGLDAWSPEPGWTLPPLGLMIVGPGLLAYHAEEAAGHRFAAPTLAAARRGQVFRAFGDTDIVTGVHPVTTASASSACR